MPLKVTYKNVQRGPFQKLTFTVENRFENYDYYESVSYLYTNGEKRVIHHTIDNMVEVHIQFLQRIPIDFKPDGESNVNLVIFVMITARKHKSAKDLTVKLNITCDALKFSDQLMCTDKLVEYIEMGKTHMDYKDGVTYMLNDFEINFSVNKVEMVTFAKLYDDTALTDFHLSAADGSVAVHKACLAAHSDVFKTLFSGTWKETTDGRVQIEGVTLASLQHLKDYIYLGTLPDEGLHTLLLLSSYYFMETLKTECISKLVKLVQPENLYSLLEFACANNIPELTFAILLQAPDDVVHKTYQIKKSLKQADEK